MDAFPDAKLILTLRDPQTWYQSLVSTIRRHMELRDRWPIRIMLYFKGQEVFFNNKRIMASKRVNGDFKGAST